MAGTHLTLSYSSKAVVTQVLGLDTIATQWPMAPKLAAQAHHFRRVGGALPRVAEV